MTYNCKYCPYVSQEYTKKEDLAKDITKHLLNNHWDEMIAKGRKLRAIKKQDFRPIEYKDQKAH